MSRKGSRFRSYKEKKNQSKVFRTYIVRTIIIVLFFSFFTSFFAIATKVNSNSMSPNIDVGDLLILFPYKNLSLILGKDFQKGLNRGDLVISETTYSTGATLIERILDPLVRIFTLQKKSLIYDNSEYKGRAELLRVVGLPGDAIKIKDYTLYVKPKGEEFFLSEFELTDKDYDLIKPIMSGLWKNEYPYSSETGEIHIAADQFFLISDNREILNDSRVFGPVDGNFIVGKVILKYWPINEFSTF